MERGFGDDELIVSKTDPKGVILYANQVFLRVSAYPERDVVGQPHNLIRHPDMPRCVFQLMWQQIAAGHEIFAYVLNLAGDGAQYWVYAHVSPSFDAAGRIIGYHSNRRVPHRSAVEQVGVVYRQLCDVERGHRRPADAMAAGADHLSQVLAGSTYDEWVWQLTNSTARERR